jgi:hypothetical protein
MVQAGRRRQSCAGVMRSVKSLLAGGFAVRFRMPSPAMLVALLALFVALGGSSYAALRLPKGSVGPKQLKKNAVTSTKVKPGSLLTSDFKASQRSALRGPQGAQGAQGAQGPQGTQGPQGPAGASATPLWAAVAANGSLTNGSGVVSTQYLIATAAYEVVFDRPVANCALLVTPRLPASEGVERIGAMPRPNTPASVYVRARHIADGAWAQEHGFYLAVFC